VGGELTLNAPDVIVIKQEIKGSTSITEKLSIDLIDLKLTTSWGGLTGSVSATIQIRKRKILEFKPTSKTYFEQGGLLPVTIPLPSLQAE